RMTNAGSGDLMFLHGLEQSGLGLGGSAVNFVGEDHVGKNRAANEEHLAAVAGVLENLSAGDVSRHEVGCELDALEFEVKDARNGFDEESFGKARRTRDEAMAASKERDKDLLDDVFLADNDLAELGLDLDATKSEALDDFAFGLNGGRNGFFGRDFCECAHHFSES